ncbi:MAG: sensor histidine kinase, partial [Desulfonatronovibrionaceae bacterium]
IVITVKDTGRGIPADIREKIFNPFFSTKKGEGAGLGLAMTKKILDDMGGTLELFSQENQGTTIMVYLPPSLAVEGGTEKPPADSGRQ